MTSSEQNRREYREPRRTSDLVHDIKYALRQLRGSPGFALTAIVTLALGIGSNTTIFSLFDQVLMRPLPVSHPHELVRLVGTGAWAGGSSPVDEDDNGVLSYPLYKDLRTNNNGAFSGLIASFPGVVGAVWQNQTENVSSELVSGNYFDVLGIKPAIGRLLTIADETVDGADPVVVLSYSYWRSHFASSPLIINQTLLLNGRPYTILGVSGDGFEGSINGYKPSVFVPVTMLTSLYPTGTQGWLARRQQRWLAVVGRLNQGQTAKSGQTALEPLWHSLRRQEYSGLPDQSDQLQRQYVDQSHLNLVDNSRGISPTRDELQKPLWILMGMDALLAAICCVNVATLLLLRSTGRIKEISIRYALGAGRRRILSQLLIEGAVLGSIGALIGLALTPISSSYLIRIITQSSPGNEPYHSHLDIRILLFNLGMAAIISLLFSAAPAVQFLNPSVAIALRQNTGTASASSLLFRKLAVGVQIGLSILLLGGAGLFLKTVHNLLTQSIGYHTDHLLTFSVSTSTSGYGTLNGQLMQTRILGALQALPGVRQTAGTTNAELSGVGTANYFGVQGYNPAPGEDMVFAAPNVTPRYFATLAIPLIAGREFTDSDKADTYKVAIVSEMIAKRFFGSPQNAIGKVIGAGGFSGLHYDTRIVGVAAEVRHDSIRETGREPVYRPFLQSASPDLSFYVRTSQDPKSLENAIIATVHRMDSKLPVDGMLTMEEQVNESISDEKSIALLASGFSVMALIMTAIGLYGVLAYATAQRSREIGIRLALGATRGAVIKLVTREMAFIALISAILAIPISVVLSRLLSSQLYRVSPSDPMALTGAVIITAAIVCLAAAVPVQRATSVNPAQTLRTD